MGAIYCCTFKQHDFSDISDFTIPKVLKEASILGCKVKISFGKLIKQDTDAVMTVCDIIGYKNLITTEIIKMGGQQVQQELQQRLEENREIDYGTVISTHGGELRFDYIFFGMIPTLKTIKHQRQFVFQCVSNTLKQTEILFLNSVSLPVLPISNDSGLSALVMLMSIKVYLEETFKHRKNLDLINITIEVYQNKKYTLQDRDDIDSFLSQFKRIFLEQKGFDQELAVEQASRENCNPVSEIILEREQDFLNNFGHAYFSPHKKIQQQVGSI